MSILCACQMSAAQSMAAAAEAMELLEQENTSLRAELGAYQRALAMFTRVRPADLLTSPNPPFPKMVHCTSSVLQTDLYSRVSEHGNGTFLLKWCKDVDKPPIEWWLMFPDLVKHGTGVSMVTAHELSSYDVINHDSALYTSLPMPKNAESERKRQRSRRGARGGGNAGAAGPSSEAAAAVPSAAMAPDGAVAAYEDSDDATQYDGDKMAQRMASASPIGV